MPSYLSGHCTHCASKEIILLAMLTLHFWFIQAVSAVIPCVKELATDSSQYVRASLASVVMELAPVIGKQATTEHLLPSFLSLLKDIYPDVRLNVISNLDQINQVKLFQRHC